LVLVLFDDGRRRFGSDERLGDRREEEKVVSELIRRRGREKKVPETHLVLLLLLLNQNNLARDLQDATRATLPPLSNPSRPRRKANQASKSSSNRFHLYPLLVNLKVSRPIAARTRRRPREDLPNEGRRKIVRDVLSGGSDAFGSGRRRRRGGSIRGDEGREGRKRD